MRFTNWIHNQIYKILEAKSKDTNVRFFITQLLSRMKEIERKGTFFFGDDEEKVSPSVAFNQKKL